MAIKNDTPRKGLEVTVKLVSESEQDKITKIVQKEKREFPEKSKTDFMGLPSGRSYLVEYSAGMDSFDSRRLATYGVINGIDDSIRLITSRTPGIQFKEIKFSYEGQ